MPLDERAKRRARLACWLLMNALIFIVCYLNYRLQLKHRYLYKILSAGLCFSRAAAMVININLLLVWLPMCKYSLTRLALQANRMIKRTRQAAKFQGQLGEHEQTGKLHVQLAGWPRDKATPVLEKLIASLSASLATVKINLLSNFVLAVDNCTSIHTVLASTITLASMVHSIAHLMNVVNFSRNFHPFLSNLNMAEFKGQNPLALLNSVPGITGSLMVLILLLMSLSSLQIIRNSSFDLFQILHRLSIVFVVLLLLHPLSHVLKEQSNVSRHHPEWCDLRLTNQSLTAVATTTTTTAGIGIGAASGHHQAVSRVCLDARPNFVAQSSISLYFLLAGLACYLIDLALRKQRRSRSPVHLLASNWDPRGNLLELTLSSNHRRFNNWLPGQFVYLNCPQVSQFEWHPFTISSMHFRERKFTLHIKTSGDWTRRLNCLLDQSRAHSLLLERDNKKQHLCHDQPACIFGQYKAEKQSYLLANILAADMMLESCNSTKLASSPQLLACTTVVASDSGKQEEAGNCRSIGGSNLATSKVQDHHHRSEQGREQDRKQDHKVVELFVDGPFHSPFERLLEQQVSVCVASGVGWTAFSSILSSLSSHSSSPYFRTTGGWQDQFASSSPSKSTKSKPTGGLESLDVVQQHQTTNTIDSYDSGSISSETVWQLASQVELQSQDQKRATLAASCNLHLMIIVANVDQLRPFYALAKAYFGQLDGWSHSPLRDISVFLTRSCQASEEIENFCKLEQLEPEFSVRNCIKVNDLFRIYFGRPQLDAYLQQFRFRYPTIPKISVYCCGSYEVKRTVRAACRLLSEARQRDTKATKFTYHEESF